MGPGDEVDADGSKRHWQGSARMEPLAEVTAQLEPLNVNEILFE